MRIADNMNYAQVNTNLNRNRKESIDLNGQAATMKRITKPSDDPTGTARVLGIRTDVTGFTQYEKSLQYAKSFLEFSEQSLSELSDLLVRMKEVAIGQANEAGANADTRRSTAAEVEQSFRQAIQIANRKMGDRFLFGGFKTVEPPFAVSGKYQGDSGELMIEVDKGSYVAMNLPGNKVFLGQGFATADIGGVDESTPKNAAELRKLQQGIRAAKGESPVEKTPEEKAAPQESVDMRGPASVSKETKAVKKDGENLFGIIRAFHTGLTTNDTGAIQNTLERFDEAINQVVTARAQAGSRLMTLNNTVESLSRQSLDSKSLSSQIEDANAFELFSDINKNETTLKATLETSGRLIAPSLLDFLK